MDITPAAAGALLFTGKDQLPMSFERFSHQVSPLMWVVITIICLRGLYYCVRKKDYPHACAFLLVVLFSAYAAAAAFGLLPEGYNEFLFG
ncbi:MAG: hypothetical protein LUF25_07460 [Phascolarctobacterium sp.]|nr:hypothetical protein [Phascolarctobacterium sp.]